MDVFANVSLEWFKILTWAFALAIGAGWFALSDHSKTREVVKSVLNSLLAAASVFFLANLGVIIYILLHMTDPRWSEGKDPLWRPRDQEFNIPGLGNVLQSINEMSPAAEIVCKPASKGASAGEGSSQGPSSASKWLSSKRRILILRTAPP